MDSTSGSLEAFTFTERVTVGQVQTLPRLLAFDEVTA